MARGKLTDRVVRQINQPGVYEDGDGLRLKVQHRANGTLTKNWVLRFQLEGVRREIGLGNLNLVSLADAREKARAKRVGIKDRDDPRDPLEERAKKKAERAAERARATSFRLAAATYIEEHAPTWKNPKHAAQWPATLKAYVFPVFGDVPVSEVDRAMVLKVLKPIWNEKRETARRIRSRIELVLDYAAAHGWRSGDNPARWRGALDKVLSRTKPKGVAHHAAVPVDEMHALLQEVATREGVGARLLEFIAFTCVRFSEGAGAAWGEIDTAKRVWSIPPPRMKGQIDRAKAHRVPLSDQAIGVLERMRREREAMGKACGPNDLVFESHLRKGARLSDQTVSAVLRRLGRSETTHGLRSTFRDWAGERTAFPREVAEAALAHKIGDAVEQAYARGDLFEKRRALMNAWGAFLMSPPPSGDVVTLRAKKEGEGRG